MVVMASLRHPKHQINPRKSRRIKFSSAPVTTRATTMLSKCDPFHLRGMLSCVCVSVLFDIVTIYHCFAGLVSDTHGASKNNH
jgi:hypothetical protein